MRLRVHEAMRRVGGLVRRRSMERRLDDEMRFHLEMLTRRHVDAGRPPDEARRLALVEFGGAERFKDEAREEYGSRYAGELAQDARYAARVLRRNPAFTTAAALTFALGIGASTAMFSVVHGVLLRPLPYADPDRLVVLWERNAARGADQNVVAVPNFEAWRAQARSFDGMAALVPLPATIATGPSSERLMGAEVSPGYFTLLGVAPALGREFTAEEERGGGADVIVLSDGFWHSHFAADPAVVGRVLDIGGDPHTIIGVMPPSFDPPRFAWLQEQAFWRPFGATESNRRWGRFLLVVARVKRDVSLEAAEGELEAIAARRASEDRSNEGWSASLTPLARQITGDVRLPLLVLLSAVGLLLLMAVTNVATLTLGLVRRRTHELAVRRAIGATTSRVVRQLVTQGAVVGVMGCLLGLIAAVAGVRAFIALLPPGIPRMTSIRMDAPVLLFTVVTSLLASLTVGVVAGVAAARDGTAALRESGGGRAAARLRGGNLVTAEIALGLVLTVLAGLALRTFAALRAVDLGFAADHVVVARVALSGARYRTPDARRQFFADLLERIRAVPGVQAAGTVSTRPFGGMAPATTLGDATRAAEGDSLVADVRYAEGGVFHALRVPLLAGGTFDARDAARAPPRAVVNATLARKLWGSSNAVGRRLRIPMFGGITPEVIGVVGDVHLMDARTPPRGTVYLSNRRYPSDALDVVVRGTLETAPLVTAVRRVVASLDPAVPVFDATPLDGLVGRSLARDRFTAMILGAFAFVSLLLAGVGIYGVFAGDVAQRRKEIGIRVALGASRRGVMALIMRRATGRAIIGVALGSVAALLAARAMASLLYGVGSADPASFLGVAMLLMLVATGATLIPALRAARVSPMAVIREE